MWRSGQTQGYRQAKVRSLRTLYAKLRSLNFIVKGYVESQKDVKLESDKKYVPLRMNTLATIQGNNQEGKDYVCA